VAGNQQRFQTAMLHGDRFSEEGKWLDAMKAYRYALAEFPNNAAAIIGFGKSALASNHKDVANKAFVQALKINPTNLEALQLMGDVQERRGQLDAAAETYLRMGNVYSARADLDAAIDQWLRATRLASGHTGARMKLADALVQQGKTRLAAREFLTVAAIYQRQGNAAQVAKLIATAESLIPGDPGVQAALQAAEAGERIDPQKISDIAPESTGTVEFFPEFSDDEEDPFGLDKLFAEPDEQNRFVGGLTESARTRAMEQIANLVFEDSDNPGVLFIMQALDAQKHNDRLEAINIYRQAIENGVNMAALHFNQGLLHRELGQLSEAAESLEMAITDDSYAASAHFVLGEIYYATNDVELAVRHTVDALANIDMATVSGHRAYDLAQKYENYATQYLEQHNPQQIRQFLTTVQDFFASAGWEQKGYEARMRMNSLSDDDNTMSLAEFLETPETEVMVNTLATTSEYIRQKLFMSASEECLRAIQQAPSFLPLHARLAEILLKQNHTNEAITKYLYVSRVYKMRGQPDQAVNTLQKILKLAPMDVTVRSSLIDLFIDSDDLTQALDESLILADSYYQLAQVDRSLGKYDEAIKLAERVSDGQKWQEQALLRIADIYNQRFDWARATNALETLRRLRPDDEQICCASLSISITNKAGQNCRGLGSSLDALLGIYQRQNPVDCLGSPQRDRYHLPR
jgi:tetratricopeptide (TPR) repeat protein